MKELPITKFGLGEPDHALDLTDDSNSSRNRCLLVCDFPAMKTVGLSEKPALILGHDFLHADYDSHNDKGPDNDTRMGIDGLRRKNLVFDPVLNFLYLGS